MAEENAARLRGRKSPIEVRIADAATADLSEASIVVMFNPFGESTLRDVLHHLEQSHKALKRPLTIVYTNPLFSNAFQHFPWLKKMAETASFAGLKMSVYQARYEDTVA
jgi:hypothetical protein